MQRVEQAVAAYRNPLNCAQTICNAFGRADLVEKMATCGRGGSPDHMCGSLYAATLLAPEHAEEMKAAFEAANGTLFCRFHGAKCKLPCPDCVRTAATLLVRYEVQGTKYEV